jgi:hypothetical protein
MLKYKKRKIHWFLSIPDRFKEDKAILEDDKRVSYEVNRSGNGVMNDIYDLKVFFVLMYIQPRLIEYGTIHNKFDYLCNNIEIKCFKERKYKKLVIKNCYEYYIRSAFNNVSEYGRIFSISRTVASLFKFLEINFFLHYFYYMPLLLFDSQIMRLVRHLANIYREYKYMMEKKSRKNGKRSRRK